MTQRWCWLCLVLIALPIHTFKTAQASERFSLGAKYGSRIGGLDGETAQIHFGFRLNPKAWIDIEGSRSTEDGYYPGEERSRSAFSVFMAFRQQVSPKRAYGFARLGISRLNRSGTDSYYGSLSNEFNFSAAIGAGYQLTKNFAFETEVLHVERDIQALLFGVRLKF